MPIQRSQIDQLCTQYPELGIQLRHFARMPSITCTSNQEMVNIGGSTPFRISNLFDELAEIGLGRHQPNWESILPGTVRGRFYWNVSSESLGKLYLGELNVVEVPDSTPQNPQQDGEDGDLEFGDNRDEDAENADTNDDTKKEVEADGGNHVPDAKEDDIMWNGYVFPLRKDKDIKLELPSDFTIGEAERFALFLKSLPLAGEFPKDWSEEEETPENTFRYLLRHGLWIETDFPADFTDDEARRLGLFLLSLPIPEN